MPDSTPTRPELLAALLEAKAADPDATTRELASVAHIPKSTVFDVIARYGPVAETLGHVKRDEAIAGWQSVGFKAVAAMDDMLDAPRERGFAKDIQGLAIAAGIAWEKTLLLAGQPTQLVAHAHEVRVQLPEMLAKLVRVGSLPVGSGGTEDGATSGAEGANPAISAQPAGCVLPAATDEEAR